MTVYYVDDGGDGSDGSTWAKAYTSLSALDDAVAIAAGDIIYTGHDHVCQYPHSAHRTITGPSAALPCYIISATQGSNPPAYQASVTNQIDTTEGVYNLTFDGSFAFHGVKMESGGAIRPLSTLTEIGYFKDCTFKYAANSYMFSTEMAEMYNCTIDLTNDGTTDRATRVLQLSACSSQKYFGLSFVNAGYRTASIVMPSAVSGDRGSVLFSGCDFSGFTNASCGLIDISQNSLDNITFNNCMFPESMVLFVGTIPKYLARVVVTNCYSANSPTQLAVAERSGYLYSSTSIYRTGGGTIETIAVGWNITTTAYIDERHPFKSEYIYGLVASTGSKTFDVYITNDTADFTNAEVWLEVEYLGTSSEAIFSLADNHRATILTAAADQTDDTTSTWNGAGPSFTYKQKLSVTATVNVAGLYRARVCVAKASIASSSYFYIDPKVTVS